MYRITTNKTLGKALFSLSFYLLLSWCMTVSSFAQSQQNAVDGTLQMIPPYPINLINYAKPTNDKVKLTLTLNPAFWENGNTTVKLRLMLEKGNSLMAQSLDIDALTGVKSVVLVPGVPYTLTPEEILTYFRLPTLQGIDEATYSRVLTEGVYRLTVLVYATQGKLKDISKGQPISGAISQQFWIVDNEPPLLNVPHTGDNVKNKLAQAINFQWIPRAIQAASNTTYEFKITEIAAENAGNPYPEFINKPALKTLTVTNTPYVSYTPNQLGLIAGKTYAWRVRAKSSDFFNTEIVSYKNDGYSDIFTFRYSGTCDKPLGLKLEAKTSDLVATSWTLNPAHLSYRVAYRKYQPGQNWQWFEKSTNTNYLNLTELQSNTEYEVTVGGLCAENFLSYSDTLRVKTLDVGQIKDVICGVLPPTDIANKNPLASLAVGDVITAGDFAVNITRILGGGGNFTGEGFIGVPWIGPKLKVKFNSITVNTDKKLINGFIETAYDPNGKYILDIDKVIQEIKAFVDLIQDLIDTAIENSRINEIVDQIKKQIEENMPAELQAALNAALKDMSDAKTAYDAAKKLFDSLPPGPEKEQARQAMEAAKNKFEQAKAVLKQAKTTNGQFVKEAADIIRLALKAILKDYQDNNTAANTKLTQSTGSLNQIYPDTNLKSFSEITSLEGLSVSETVIPIDQADFLTASEKTTLKAYLEDEYKVNRFEVSKVFSTLLDTEEGAAKLAIELKKGGKDLGTYIFEKKKVNTPQETLVNEVKDLLYEKIENILIKQIYKK